MRSRGQATVELALALPVLLVVVLAAVQIGLLARDQLVVVQASRAGAREAAVTPDDGSVRASVAAAAVGLASDALTVGIARDAPPGPVVVTLTYAAPIHVPFVGWLFPRTVELSARAVARQEFA